MIPTALFGKFSSEELRSNVAGLELPEFSKEHKPGKIPKPVAILPAFSIVVLSFIPWKWRHYIPPKRRNALTQLHVITSQKTHVLNILLFWHKTRYIQRSLVGVSSVTWPWPLPKIWICRAWELTLRPVDQCRQTWTREWTSREPPSNPPLSTVSTHQGKKSLFRNADPVVTVPYHPATIVSLSILSSLLFTIMQRATLYILVTAVSLNHRELTFSLYRAVTGRISL